MVLSLLTSHHSGRLNICILLTHESRCRRVYDRIIGLFRCDSPYIPFSVSLGVQPVAWLNHAVLSRSSCKGGSQSEGIALRRISPSTAAWPVRQAAGHQIQKRPHPRIPTPTQAALSQRTRLTSPKLNRILGVKCGSGSVSMEGASCNSQWCVSVLVELNAFISFVGLFLRIFHSKLYDPLAIQVPTIKWGCVRERVDRQ